MRDPSDCLSLADELTELELSEREWLVLEGRTGIGERLTLLEMSDRLQISRERVRQIEKSAASTVIRHMRILEPPAQALEDQGGRLWDPFSPQIPQSDPVRTSSLLLVRAGWQWPGKADVLRFFAALRAAIDEGNTVVEKNWPRLSYAVCGLPPVITKHARAAKQEERRLQELRDQRQPWSYLRLATKVLKRAGTPLHWKEIANRAEALGQRAEFNAGSFFNTLTLNPTVFARVGQGTYGLIEDGFQRVENYDDIIADVMKRSENPLTFGEILQEVNDIRPIASSSLQMYLDLHARFFCSLDGRYGLRARLLPPEKQTLRTPPWQVEDPDSYERLRRERAKGIDVEGIIAEDREP